MEVPRDRFAGIECELKTLHQLSRGSAPTPKGTKVAARRNNSNPGLPPAAAPPKTLRQAFRIVLRFVPAPCVLSNSEVMMLLYFIFPFCADTLAPFFGVFVVTFIFAPIPAAKLSFADNTSTVPIWFLDFCLGVSCGGPPHYLTRGTQACSRRSRSCKSRPPVWLGRGILNFFGSFQRQCSAWPSTKERLQPWPCLSAGKSTRFDSYSVDRVGVIGRSSFHQRCFVRARR